MKKLILLVLILIAGSYSVFAQGLHLDLNLGGGLSAREDKDRVKEEGERVDGSPPWTTGWFFCVGAGAGYGPFEIPLYFVGEYKFYMMNSHYVGGGVIYYPFGWGSLQVGTTLGYASKSGEEEMDIPVNGFMWNVHFAFSSIEGSYVGFRYSLMVNDKTNHMFGIFYSFSFGERFM
jgi:hypothetical protein